MREAARWASDVPMATLEACLEVVSAAESLAGRCNANAASDIGRRGAPRRGGGTWSGRERPRQPAVGRRRHLRGRDDGAGEADRRRHPAARGDRATRRSARASPASRSGREGLTRVPSGGARLLQGGPIAAEIRAGGRRGCRGLPRATRPRAGLAVVICGRDAPSMVYLQQILRSCEKVGIEGRLVEVDGEASEASVADAIRDAQRRPGDQRDHRPDAAPADDPAASIVDAIDPAKDIDGIHPLNAGLLRLGYDGFLPATAHAAVEILRRSGIEIEGKRAVVVGRSAVVGMPAAFLLVRENATVTVCHSRTRDLARHVQGRGDRRRRGRPPGPDPRRMLRRGAVVVDVGINVVDGALVGDVDFESARRVASAITPGAGRRRATDERPAARPPRPGRQRPGEAALGPVDRRGAPGPASGWLVATTLARRRACHRWRPRRRPATRGTR